MSNSPKKILVIATRRLGDVLLVTPLIRSLRLSYPNAVIDVLVFNGTEGVLTANPDINKVITCVEGARAVASIKEIYPLFRKYDMAVSTLAGDRPTIYAWLAGKYRVGTLAEGKQSFWKRALLNKWVPFDDIDTHTVRMGLKIATLLGIDVVSDVVVSWSAEDEKVVEGMLTMLGSSDFAVLHTYPRFRYKMWNEQGWIELAKWLRGQGLAVVLTGSAEKSELEYVQEIHSQIGETVLNLAGRLSLTQTGFLMSKARLYVGPDTVTTHIAAALGIPTVALYGPTNPVKWGPFPKGFLSQTNPYIRRGIQKVGNVILIQSDMPCVPCHQEGCGKHIESASECLECLESAVVIKVVQDELRQIGA